MEILCVFYGIGRALELSEPSIEKKLLAPLSNIGHHISSIYVLNEVRKICNPRSGEQGNISPIRECIFRKCKIIRTNENLLIDKKLFSFSKNYWDRYRDGFVSNKNLICQLSMLELANDVVDFMDYDRVILCRDDIAFLNSTLNWKRLLAVSEFGPVVSLWHWHGGINDRFAICLPNAAGFICSRKKLIYDYFTKYRYLHAESLQYYCFRKNNMMPHACNIRLVRCRIDGRFHIEKFRIPVWRPYETLRMLLAFSRYLLRSLSSMR